MCNCKYTELVTGIVVLVLALWPNMISANVSKWIIVVAAVVLIVHSLGCKNMSCCDKDAGATKSVVSNKKKK